ncbi:hypothetical protein C8J56DRAFT_583748 [Mycena floridula]|nr:hypothetical protein C8J56DRAFT_583748 [Mycena floridula]
MLDGLRILQGSRQLRKLTVILDDHHNTLQPELKFAHLHVLHCPSPFLDAFLELPQLEELNLNPSGLGPGHSDNLVAVPKFIQRVSPQIRSLILPERRQFSIVDLFHTLDMLPGLQILHFRGTFRDWWNDLMDYLCVDPNQLDRARLPQLQHIVIETTEETETYRCIEMIESRFSLRYDFPRLKSVGWLHLWAKKEVPEVVQVRFEELRRQGLSVWKLWSRLSSR